MSWQADIKKLHEKSSSLGVDLTEFEDEIRNDEGWYTESNIQELIECQNLQIAKQQEEIAEYRKLLARLNDAGGLGFSVHARIDAILAKHNKGE